MKEYVAPTEGSRGHSFGVIELDKAIDNEDIGLGDDTAPSAPAEP